MTKIQTDMLFWRLISYFQLKEIKNNKKKCKISSQIGNLTRVKFTGAGVASPNFGNILTIRVKNWLDNHLQYIKEKHAPIRARLYLIKEKKIIRFHKKEHHGGLKGLRSQLSQRRNEQIRAMNHLDPVQEKDTLWRRNNMQQLVAWTIKIISRMWMREPKQGTKRRGSSYRLVICINRIMSLEVARKPTKCI